MPSSRHSAGQRRARRTGITALSLLAATVVAALLLARGYHLGVAATLVALLGGLPGLYLMWAAYRDDRAAESGTEMDLAEIADELAAAVRAQWEAEAAARRLDNPLLPVRWTPADWRLAEDWQSLVALATTGAGWPEPPPAGTWAIDAAHLAGESADIARVLARIPTGRLVVLGEPGSGKTMLLVRLLLDLLIRRKSGAPVPILVSLASWNPVLQELHEWLAAELTADHPALAAPAPAGSRGQAMLARGMILPVLDGLDELPETLWAAAITRINDALRPGEAVVVSSRSAAYWEAVCLPQGAATVLRGAAVIEMCPVDAPTAARYLLHGSSDTDRWAPVLAALGTSTPVGQVLAAPLMIGLAREIYCAPPGTSGMMLREPAELCLPAMSSRETIEQYLLDAYIPAAYRRPPSSPGPRRKSFTSANAERWLEFLAQHLEHGVGSPDFAWWQMERALPHPVSAIAAAITAVLGAGLTLGVAAVTPTGMAARTGAALAVGLITGLIVWFIVQHPQRPMTRVGWSLRFPLIPAVWRKGWQVRKRFGKSLMLTVLTFPVVAVLAGLVFGPFALLVWLLLGLIAMGIHGVYGDVGEVASPQAVLTRDRRSVMVLGLVAIPYSVAGGFVLGSAVGRGTEILFRTQHGLTLGAAAGLAFGITLPLGFGLIAAAWPRWEVTCASLAISRRLPLRLMNFLQDAHRRGVLRQAGAMYQFRHLELQRRLASRTL